MAYRLHPLYFYPPRRNDRNHHLHDVRDGVAMTELVAARCEQGYRYGSPLFNPPPREPHAPGMPPRRMDLRDVEPTDEILLTTRPPKDDRFEGERKQVPRGWTDLEEIVLGRSGLVFDHLSRGSVRISEAVRTFLPAEFADWAKVEFQRNSPPRIQARNALDGRGWIRLPRHSNTTAGYLLRLSELWEGGPGLVAAFSMAGDSTLFWVQWLRTRRPSLLEKPGFAMAELTIPDVPGAPTSFAEAGAEDVAVRILLSVEENAFAAN